MPRYHTKSDMFGTSKYYRELSIEMASDRRNQEFQEVPLQPTIAATPFLDGLKRRELILPRCALCAELHYYPQATCPRCFSSELDWVVCSGLGRIYSYVIDYKPRLGLQDQSPRVIAIVELEEGPRIMGNLSGIGNDYSEVQVNMLVRIVFEKLDDEMTLLTFVPA